MHFEEISIKTKLPNDGSWWHHHNESQKHLFAFVCFLCCCENRLKIHGISKLSLPYSSFLKKVHVNSFHQLKPAQHERLRKAEISSSQRISSK